MWDDQRERGGIPQPKRDAGAQPNTASEQRARKTRGSYLPLLALPWPFFTMIYSSSQPMVI